MTPRDCPRFDECDAPLCPMDEDRAKRTWFPDEPICDRGGMGTTRFVKIQKRIAKAVVLTDTFFTVPMLEAVGGVKAGIAGLDPDSNADRQHREREWIKKHSRAPIRVWTPAEREAARERMKKIRRSRWGLSALCSRGAKGSELSDSETPSPIP